MAADPVQLERDEARFETLYREYAGDVYRYALAIMRNPADAEDVTQTTFLNAWRAYSAGEEPRAPLNWFISIAHNVCRLRFRTNSRRPREVEFEPALAEAPATDGPSVSDVLDALAELPINQRGAIVMRELEGRSYTDIATALGVSRSAVETLIFRARRSLRIRREAIGSLALLPLPSSLASFFRARGVVETGAGAALGSGIAAKAVAVVAAGLVAAGAVHQTVLDEGNVAPDVSRATPARSAPAPTGPGFVRDESARELAAAKHRAAARAEAPAPGRPAAQRSSSVQSVGLQPPAPPPSAGNPPARPSGPRPRPASPKPGAAEPPARTVPDALPMLPALPALPVPELPSLPPVSVPPVAAPPAAAPPVVPPQPTVPPPVPSIEAPALPDVAVLP
jgi:RNA polymerase sigma factor (sigma-70 family)